MTPSRSWWLDGRSNAWRSVPPPVSGLQDALRPVPRVGVPRRAPEGAAQRPGLGGETERIRDSHGAAVDDSSSGDAEAGGAEPGLAAGHQLFEGQTVQQSVQGGAGSDSVQDASLGAGRQGLMQGLVDTDGADAAEPGHNPAPLAAPDEHETAGEARGGASTTADAGSVRASEPSRDAPDGQPATAPSVAQSRQEAALGGAPGAAEAAPAGAGGASTDAAAAAHGLAAASPEELLWLEAAGAPRAGGDVPVATAAAAPAPGFGRPIVALLFLTRGPLPHEPTWRAFLAGAAVLPQDRGPEGPGLSVCLSVLPLSSRACSLTKAIVASWGGGHSEALDP
jgi:hypothetical protein